MDRPLTIVFAGGGTGGHLTPGIAVAERVADLDPDARLVFLGTGRAIEKRLLANAGYELRVLRAASSPQSLSDWARLPARLLSGWLDARRALNDLDPDALVALGGYAALLPGLAAARRGVPLVVLEQNAIPGRTNVVLSGRAQEVVTSWESAAPHFKKPERVAALGNPVRRCAMALDRQEACRRLGLSPDRKTIVVIGGSQGAAAINRLVWEALPRLAASGEALQIVHSVGEIGYEEAAAAYADSPLPVRFEKFFDDAAAVYGCADAAVCRAGGTTLAELTANGVPSILIPYPYAAADHQFFNARLLSDAGAAVLRRQSDLSGDILSTLLLDLLTNDSKRAAMAEAARALGRPEAAQVTAERIMRLARERRRLRRAS